MAPLGLPCEVVQGLISISHLRLKRRAPSGRLDLPPPLDHQAHSTRTNHSISRVNHSTRTEGHLYVNITSNRLPGSIRVDSFQDISARSPIMSATTSPRPRQSLDARQMRIPSTNISASPSLRSTTRPSTGRVSTDQHSRPRRPSATPYQPKPNVLPDNFVNPPSFQPDESADAASNTDSNTSPSTSAMTDGISTNPTTPSNSPPDRFEDVGLGEAHQASAGQPEAKKLQQPPQPQVKKPSIFARFGGSSDAATVNKDDASTARPGSSGLGIGLGMFGRKRGASGQGSELGSIPQSQAQPSQAKRGSASAASAASTTAPAGTVETKPDA